MSKKLILVELANGRQVLGRTDFDFEIDCNSIEDECYIRQSAFKLADPHAIVFNPQNTSQATLVPWLGKETIIYTSLVCGVTDNIPATLHDAYVSVTTGLIINAANH